MNWDTNAERDQAMLDALPSHIGISQLFKAQPVTEGGQRFVYLEASNEARDYQNEVILAQALADSADYYLKYGNLDLDHYTQIGKPNPAKNWPGIPNYEWFEIGRPVDARIDGKRTFVKGHISSGTGPAAEKANLFWSSLTELNPPQVWYPSVGGAVLEKSTAIDPSTGTAYPVIKKVRWTNIGFSKTPVNPDVPEVSTIPIGVLAKSWSAQGLDLRKTLSAGYGTDSATLSGGSALRQGNGNNAGVSNGGVLDYWNFRDRFSQLVMSGEVSHGIKDMVMEAASRFGLSRSVAAEYVERFLDDLQRGMQERKQKEST
ncbi:MAG TPA: hypothetical protein VF472_07305 [Burkholderiaceae bacterium]